MQTKAHKAILAVTFALVAILASAIPVAAQSSHFTVRMENNTGYDIYQVRLSSVTDSYWHRDLLGDSVLQNGESFTITEIAPGRYDLAFVDEDGDVCLVHGVAIYSNLNWNLSHTWLLNCER